jgi:hypothetical protein
MGLLAADIYPARINVLEVFGYYSIRERKGGKTELSLRTDWFGLI